MEAWRLGGSEAWRFGGLEDWRLGGWWLGGLEALSLGGLEGWCSPLLAKAKEGGHPMSKERAETHVSHVSCTLLLARIHI